MKNVRCRLLLCAWVLCVLPEIVWAGIIQGPVKGTVHLADGRQALDIVVRLICFSSGIHGGHRADNISIVVASDEEFVIPWAYRGLVPIRCLLYAYHPRYVVEERSLGDEFSQQLGTIQLESWEAFLDRGPIDPPVYPRYAWPVGELGAHLYNLNYHYIPTFEEGPERQALGRYVPSLHAILRRGMATGAFDLSPPQTFQRQIKELRQFEDAVSFPYALSELYEAISHNDGSRVTHIIKGGAFLDGWGKKGQGALFYAALNGYTDAALALIDGGVDIDAVSPLQKRTPLARALSQGHWKTAAALIARGASLKAASLQNTWLKNAMCASSSSGDAASLQIFVDAGIDLDIAASNGVTPLMCAARANQLPTAALLIKAGADVNARASHNRSALRYAISGRFAEMTGILKAAGATE